MQSVVQHCIEDRHAAMFRASAPSQASAAATATSSSAKATSQTSLPASLHSTASPAKQAGAGPGATAAAPRHGQAKQTAAERGAAMMHRAAVQGTDGGSAVAAGATPTPPASNASQPSVDVSSKPQDAHKAAEGGLTGQGRVIVHVDMDCFFASVALLRHPKLVNHPVAVAHSGSTQLSHKSVF